MAFKRTSTHHLGAVALTAIFFVACGSSNAPDLGPGDAGQTSDVNGLEDTGPDTGLVDAGPSDGETGDLGPRDSGDAGFDAGPPRDAGPGMRIMAANLTSGNLQSYDPGEGSRIMQALAPDIILIQEFNFGNDSPADIQMMVEQVLPGGSYYRAETGDIPNGIISRWPIISAGTWDDNEVGNRGFSWAQIDVPGPVDLWAVSLHLLTANAGTRNREAIQLVGEIQTNIPDADFLVVGGDLNTNNRMEAALMTLSAVVDTTRVPVDSDGNGETNQPRSKPYDWVLSDADLDALHRPVVIGSQIFVDGLVFDSRQYLPLSDVPPVMSTDSDAFQMQHMAVVRDFNLPN